MYCDCGNFGCYYYHYFSFKKDKRQEKSILIIENLKGITIDRYARRNNS